MASISITYTPNYEGCHRIGLKGDGIAPVPPYCVYIDYSASQIGVQKTTVITIDESYNECLPIAPIVCSNYTIDGYVQPCCAAEDDLTSRVGFKFDTVTNTCNVYTVTCTKAGIANIIVTHPGSGYTSTPVVTISNGTGGSGFSAIPNMDGDTVESVTVVNTGSNYPTTSIVRFTPSPTGDNPEAYIEFCPCGDNCGQDSYINYLDCANQDPQKPQTPFAGSSYNVCSQTLPTATNAPSVVIQKISSDDCCDCKNYRISNMEKERSLNVDYIDCNNVFQSATILPLAALVTCMVPNSLHIVEDYLVAIADLGDCP